MVQFFDSINEELGAWVLKQSVFFTASAPLVGKHINVSPKGLPSSSFSILSPNQVAYVDATGSGCETISHVYENGRVTIMFCSFEANPRIMRFFCTGRVVEWDQPEFEPMLRRMGMKNFEGARAVILLDVFKVQTSCGYGVPRLAKQKSEDGDEEIAGFQDRQIMGHWASNQIEKNTLHAYQQKNNSDSLDGLTGMRVSRRDRGETLWLTDTQAWLRRILGQREALAVGFTFASILFLVANLVQALLLK
jgi:hypothetical protein